MSSYSLQSPLPQPAPTPLRIRCISHPPLAPLRAWLPIVSRDALVRDLVLSVGRMLGREEVELHLQGFALLPGSPCSILDPVNDVLDVFASGHSEARLPINALIQNGSMAAQLALAAEIPAPASDAGPSTSSLGQERDSSDSSDSSTDSESDSDSDSAPEVASSRAPPPKAATAQPTNPFRIPTQPPPAKRTRRASSSSASSSSSCSSDSSSSGSSSSSSSSDSDRALAAKVPERPPVPPGMGLKATRSRNKRRRIRAEHMKLDALAAGLSPAVELESAVAGVVSQSERDRSPEFRPQSPPAFVPRLATQPAPSPTLEGTKAKGKAKAGPKGTPGTETRILFQDAPSTKTNLPPNVIVTKVDVEARDWEAGVGEVIQGTSRDWVAKGADVARAACPSGVDDAQMEDAEEEQVEEDWGAEWSGWKTPSAVESRWARWTALSSEEPFVESRRVAFKLLELDPATFTPTLSLKYGLLLPPSATNPLRVKLHPACVPEEEEYDAEDGYYGDEWRKPKFGEAIVMDGENGEPQWARRGVWEGEWQDDVRLVN